MKTPYMIAGALMGICLSASAQQPLSLSDALQRAMENHYDIRVEAEQVEIAKRNNTWGAAGLYPSITLSATQSNTVSNIDNPTSFVAGDIVNTGISPNAALNWRVFNGFGVRIAKERLERLQAETEGNAAIVLQNTLQATILAYYAAVLEQERLEVFRKTLKLSRDRFEYVKVRKDLGAAVTSDLLLAEGNYLTDSTSLINQEMACRRAMRVLNVLMNADDLDASYQFSDVLDFEDRGYRLEDLQAKMEESNANLRRQYLTQSVLRSNTSVAHTGLYPTIDLRLSYSNNINAQDLSRASFANSNQEPPSVPITAVTQSYGVSFVVSYNLFNGGAIRRAIQSAVVQERIGELRTEQLKTSLRRDLLAALDLYDVRRQLRGIAARNREVAEVNLQISEERFKNGSITSFDYRTLQNNYLLAAMGELQAVYNLIDADVQLLRLTGGIVEAGE